MDMQRKHPGYVSLNTKIKRAIWNVVALFLFRPFITKLFRKWRNLILRLFGAKIEMDAHVYASVKIWAPWNLIMGHGSCLGPDVICYNQDKVVLENHVVVSQYSYLCTASHDVNMKKSAKTSLVTAPIHLLDNSWIGSKAYVGMGVTVGEYAIVGATASVYKDVEAYSIVGGNPAKLLKYRNLGQDVQGG